MAKDKQNPSQGFENPFYRDKESSYDGGDLNVISPVGSVFSHSYLRKDGSNAMEDALSQQLRDGSSRQVTGSKKKGK